MLDPKVFKAYDIRGIYPAELDEEGAHAIGRAYVEQFEPKEIAIGRDMRVSSTSMAKALIEGATAAGANVVDIGLVGTEMLYFAVGDLELDGGIQVTASHNPKEYNGMKIVRRGAMPVGGDSGLLDIRDRAMAISDMSGGQTPGQVREEDVFPGFVDKVLSFVELDEVERRRVVIDAANGMAGVMLPPVLERIPIDAVPYFFEPDGTFPNHAPNPLLPENREFVIGRVLEDKAELGVAFDGDADRCFFIDDTGEFVPGDFVTALLAESMLEKYPGSKIIYDVRASWAVRETIERAGGIPLINRVGHAFIKERMRKEDAVFAGEVSGHYYFRDFYQADSGRDPLPAHARARLEARQASLRAPPPLPRAVLLDRRDQRARDGRGREAPGDQGAVRQRGRGLAPGRDLDRGRGLAPERAPVEHGAAAAAEPRSALQGADGAEARRGTRHHALRARLLCRACGVSPS